MEDYITKFFTKDFKQYLQNLNERSKQDVIKRDVGKSEQTTK